MPYKIKKLEMQRIGLLIPGRTGTRARFVVPEFLICMGLVQVSTIKFWKNKSIDARSQVVVRWLIFIHTSTITMEAERFVVFFVRRTTWVLGYLRSIIPSA